MSAWLSKPQLECSGGIWFIRPQFHVVVALSRGSLVVVVGLSLFRLRLNCLCLWAVLGQRKLNEDMRLLNKIKLR